MLLKTIFWSWAYDSAFCRYIKGGALFLLHFFWASKKSGVKKGHRLQYTVWRRGSNAQRRNIVFNSIWISLIVPKQSIALFSDFRDKVNSTFFHQCPATRPDTIKSFILLVNRVLYWKLWTANLLRIAVKGLAAWALKKRCSEALKNAHCSSA